MTGRIGECIYTQMNARRQPLPYLEDVRQQRHVCFAEQLRSANRAITRFYTAQLGDSEIGIAQLSLLIRLYYFGEATITRLARNLETDRTTLVRTVQLLARDGQVEVVAGTADRRERRVRLTDRGHAALAVALPRWQQAQAALRARLGDRQWDQIFSALRLLATLDDPPAPKRGRPRALRPTG